MQPRKHNSSRVYKQVKVGDDTVFVPVVEDLDDEWLLWHYTRAIDGEDYEYAQACYVEGEIRGITNKMQLQ